MCKATPRKPTMPERLTPVAVCVLAGAGLDGCSVSSRNRAVVLNSTGSEVTDVDLLLSEFGGKATVSKKAASLASGKRLAVRHGMNDLRVVLRFTTGGTPHEHTEEYVDLWTGQGWVLDIQPDGTVKSGYEGQRTD
jgi:hypothetical protein